MQVLPTNSANAGKHEGVNSAKTASGKNTVPLPGAQPAGVLPAGTPSVQAAPAAPLSMAALIAASGLPADNLSAAIISFARFFSLPLKPELMAAIRRQAITQVPSEAPAPTETTGAAETAARTRQAFSLAAAAAESKGVELSRKGLEVYAQAVTPHWRRRDSRDNERQHEQEKGPPLPKTETLTAGELKNMALRSMEIDPLLAILNRLPDKNGRRWIVLPLKIDSNIRITLRILLEGENSADNKVSHMVVDIFENGETQRRWQFAADSAGNTIQQLAVCIRPELPAGQRAQLLGELADLMGIPPKRISIHSFEWDHRNDLLHSVNEAV